MLGPNGAGKTTLLRALAGLTPLTAGQIALDGRVLDDAASGRSSAAERPVGLVFQDYRLFPHLSRARQRRLRRALAWGRPRPSHARPRPRGGWTGSVSPSSPDARARRSCPAARRSGSRSPGRWRPDPALLLLDEPLSRWTRVPGWRCGPSCGATSTTSPDPALMVTHDPLEALVLADRLLVHRGRADRPGGPAGGGRPAAGHRLRRPARRPEPVRRPRRRRPGDAAARRRVRGARPRASTGRCWSPYARRRSWSAPRDPKVRARGTPGPGPWSVSRC